MKLEWYKGITPVLYQAISSNGKRWWRITCTPCPCGMEYYNNSKSSESLKSLCECTKHVKIGTVKAACQAAEDALCAEVWPKYVLPAIGDINDFAYYLCEEKGGPSCRVGFDGTVTPIVEEMKQ